MTQMEEAQGTLVLMAQVEQDYGTYRVVTRVCRRTDTEMLTATWSYGGWDLGAEFDGLQIHAYLGSAAGLAPLDGEQGLWGQNYSYSPYRIDSTKQAKAIASVMGRLERGLQKLNDEEGYLGNEDYAGYVLRFARVLKIKGVWVRNDARHKGLTGEPYRHVTGASLQYWVADVDRTARERKLAELVRS